MSFPRYEAYKDSGVEWLGDVPKYWQCIPLKRLLSDPLRYGANEAAIDETPDQPRFVRITDITNNGNLREETFRSLSHELAEPYLLQDGDVLLARSGATVGKSFIYRPTWGQCCFAGYLIRARPNKSKLAPSFLYALCQSTFYWQYVIGEQIQATIQNVNAERYANLIVPCPPVGEQDVIVAFLDRETAKIDTLVQEQQRLIELLKEKRQAVISHAVTKGLNPDAPMKDSGVEWLGEVPEHWEVKKLRRFLIEHRQGFYSSDSYFDEGVKLLRITDIHDHGEVDFADCPRVDQRADLEPFYLEVGDFVFARTGGAGTFGLISELPEPAIYASYLIRFRFRTSAVPPFLASYFMTHGFQSELRKHIHGGVNQNVHAEDIKEQYISLPPVAEQTAICKFLAAERLKIETLQSEAEAAIALLQERRSALISAAVTGKIDVRGLASLEAEAA